MADLALLVDDPEVAAAVAASGATRIGYRPLREAMRLRRRVVSRVPPAPEPGRPLGPAPRPLTVTGLLLLDPHGHDPTPVESITVDDTGIGVVRARGHDPGCCRGTRWSPTPSSPGPAG